MRLRKVVKDVISKSFKRQHKVSFQGGCGNQSLAVPNISQYSCSAMTGHLSGIVIGKNPHCFAVTKIVIFTAVGLKSQLCWRSSASASGLGQILLLFNLNKLFRDQLDSKYVQKTSFSVPFFISKQWLQRTSNKYYNLFNILQTSFL